MQLLWPSAALEEQPYNLSVKQRLKANLNICGGAFSSLLPIYQQFDANYHDISFIFVISQSHKPKKAVKNKVIWKT